MNLELHINADERVKKFKLIALKDKGKTVKSKTLQYEKVEFKKESLNGENSKRPYDD